MDASNDGRPHDPVYNLRPGYAVVRPAEESMQESFSVRRNSRVGRGHTAPDLDILPDRTQGAERPPGYRFGGEGPLRLYHTATQYRRENVWLSASRTMAPSAGCDSTRSRSYRRLRKRMWQKRVRSNPYQAGYPGLRCSGSETPTLRPVDDPHRTRREAPDETPRPPAAGSSAGRYNLRWRVRAAQATYIYYSASLCPLSPRSTGPELTAGG